MAGISMTGMASGLPPNIVEQLIEVERIPIKKMQTDKVKREDKLKLVGDLDTKVQDISKNLEELTAAGGFLDKKFHSGDPNIIDGTVDPQASVTGEYTFEVLELAQKPAAVTNGFVDKDQTQIGVGYIKFETPEGTKEVYINGKNNTLEGVAAQINATNVGLRAQVINDRKDKETPFRLLVSGLSTGDDKQVQFPVIYMLDGDQDVEFEKSLPAKNAKVKIDGFEIEIPENQSSDLIPGVNLDFKSAAPGRPIRVHVKENLEVISGKIKSFVDAYNGALGFIQEQNKVKNNGGKNASLGPLGGDGLIRNIESTLRRVIMTPQYGVESAIKRVGDLGIEFNRNGTLAFSQDKFNKTLASSPKDVAAFLRGDGFNTGFVPTVKREVGNITNTSSSPLGNRKKSLNTQIDQINQRIETKEKQLEKKEEGLRRKFSDLESKMSGLQ
ncbi:MAG TPA: flagellar filament capping protein FliD, partial [Pseudobdellovibrionaceae bacterium]|nr:flagellar filament capping protein FliD [Pseudobdellovibrionaceae bacterium]